MSDKPRISVIGTGYLGATHAVCMAELGFEVIGARRRRGQDRQARLGRGSVLRARAARAAAPSTADCGRLRFTTPTKRSRRSRDVHFVCVGTPQRKGELRRRHALRRGGVHVAGAASGPPALVVGKSTVPAGTAARMEQLLKSWPRRRTSSWPGTRSSCARASRSRTPCARTGSSSACIRDLRRAAAARRVRAGDRGRHAGRRDRLRHRRAGEGRGELVPGHQDLVHQRDGRGLRGDRRRRHPAGRRRSGTTRGSAAGSCTPGSGSAAAACPRTSGRSSPAPGARGRPGGVVPPARSTRSTCAGGPGRSTWASSWSTARTRAPGRRAGRGVQAELRRRPGLAGAGRRGRHRSRAAGRDRLRPAGDGATPERMHPELAYARLLEAAPARRRRHAAADRVGRVQGDATRPSCPTW